MSKDTTGKTLCVAAVLCIVCSIIVSFAAVSLKEKQDFNVDQDIKKNILVAAGLFNKNETIDDQFTKIKPALIDIEQGVQVTDQDIDSFDQIKAAKDPDKNIEIPGDKDLAKIKKRSKVAKIYHVMNGEKIDQIIFPVHGKGLWSTMYGFIAIANDATTVKGFAFYSHGETPGLGGEVDNPTWKAQWPGKKIFNESFEVTVNVVKGRASTSGEMAKYEVDGLSGATITTTGVRNLLRYWFGEHGFAKYLANYRQGVL